jgi:hypothetical protein
VLELELIRPLLSGRLALARRVGYAAVRHRPLNVADWNHRQ